MALAALLVAACAISVPGRAEAGALTDRTFVHDGSSRTFREYVPSGLPAKDAPLVIVMHGGGGNTFDFDETGPTSPLSHWMAIADSEKLVVVYPHALQDNWHDCRSDAHDVTGTQDDVGFTDALIDDVARRHRIDQARVYATGWSNGGMMAYRLAMELTHRIAAIGAVIANLPEDPAGECRVPDLPITVAIMNGDAEQVFMPWDGGCVLTCAPRLERGRVLSGEATRDWWIAHNATATVAEPHDYEDTVSQDLSTVTRWLHQDGMDGTEVAFFRVRRGGHTMPSVEHRHTLGQRAVLGPQNWDVEGAAELWAVMSRHVRDPSCPRSTNGCAKRS